MNDPITINFSPTVLNGSITLDKLSPQLQQILQQQGGSSSSMIFIGNTQPEYVADSFWYNYVTHDLYQSGTGAGWTLIPFVKQDAYQSDMNALVNNLHSVTEEVVNARNGNGNISQRFDSIGSGIQVINDFPNTINNNDRGKAKFFMGTSGTPIVWIFSITDLMPSADSLFIYIDGTQLSLFNGPVAIGTYNPADYVDAHAFMIAVANGVQTNVIVNNGLSSYAWTTAIVDETSFSISTIDQRGRTASGHVAIIKNSNGGGISTAVASTDSAPANRDRFIVLGKDDYNRLGWQEVITNDTINERFRSNGLYNQTKRYRIQSNDVDQYTLNGSISILFNGIGYEYEANYILSRVFTLYKNGQPLIWGEDWQVQTYDSSGSLSVILSLTFNSFHTEFVVGDLYTLVRISYVLD